MSPSSRKARIDKLLTEMARHEIDAVIISCPQNRFYLSGFKAEDVSLNESSGMLFISKDCLVLITDSRYTEAAKEEAPDFDIFQYDQNNSLEQIVAKICREKNIKNLGIESEFLSLAKFIKLNETLRKEGALTNLTPADEFVGHLRAVKDEEEVSLIKESLRLAEEVMEEVYDFLKPGVTEREVAWFIEKRLREKGADGVSFPPIVAGGFRAALPHAIPTERPVREGEPIIIDMGARLNGYCSDITRTVFLGYIPDLWDRIYEIVLKAQNLAYEAAQPGITAKKLDGIARQFIEQAGYGAYFGHGLGHGVGIAIHEPPSIRKTGSMALEPGMVFTIEPGIYLPGEGGVRLENMVVMKNDGAELLNRLPVSPPMKK
jgi:Xaa-Pro aminopeptidase